MQKNKSKIKISQTHPERIMREHESKMKSCKKNPIKETILISCKKNHKEWLISLALDRDEQCNVSFLP